jgi:hypothetical protein
VGEGPAATEDGALSAELAATLEPRIQDALNHPVRRQVLRVLHWRGEPLDIAELHDQLPYLSRGALSYHLQVLQDSGSMVEVAVRPGPAGVEREPDSALLSDGDAMRALEVTAAVDLASLAERTEHDR